jgi:hypothetical protein
MVEIKTVALELNKLSGTHPIGRLQELRTQLPGKTSQTHKIFTKSTIFPDYAFHDGGRHEIQFNIGTEEINEREVFRYGIAFSLETSRSHPDVSELFEKVERFNYYIRTNPEAFPDFIMWYHSGPQKTRIRSSDFYPRPIEPDWAKKGNFIFLGKWVDFGELNFEEVLTGFDHLLPLYAFVEGGDDLPAPAKEASAFRPGCSIRKVATKASRIATERSQNRGSGIGNSVLPKLQT